MNFDFSEEQRMFKDALERVTRDKIEPLIAACPKDEPLPRAVCEKIREILLPMGIHGARVPEEYGGSGLGPVGLGIAAEMNPSAYTGTQVREPLHATAAATRAATSAERVTSAAKKEARPPASVMLATTRSP